MRFLRRRHCMSPLILLVLLTCFSSVLSRHRIRHHRDRFKRQQGEHLFLAGSYVFGGGDGPDLGPWSEWSSPSPCSRSCGGGVSTETRQCTPGYTCQGPTSRHFSCNTQDCPDIGDFRAQQCSEFDSVPFNGVIYQWIPYTKAPNPCELNCMPRGERFYYRHRDRVIDGTRCNDESPDVCIEGKCQPVGCDMMLGSPAREDRCRICGGNGSTCNTVTGVLDMQDLQVGYNDILLIPAGATNIIVEEREPSNNYLAVRNTSGHYYLNGNWRIDFPRTMEFAGCKFHYERNPQGFSAPDKITCLGPIDEALFIVMLFQDRNVGVNYEYSLPTNIQPGYETETYAWTFDQFTPCTQTCGGGLQYRNVTCAGRKTLEPADESLCDANNKPATSQRCAEIPCDAQWVPYPWGNCSAPCGEGGVQTREIACQQVISNGYPSLVDDSECAKSQPKPPQQQTCNKGRICSKWHTGPWKPCDHLCGDGKEKRQVRCYRNESDKIEIVDDSECTAIEPKPQTERKCNLRPCEGVDWISSVWSGCDKCGLTNETRKVMCATAAGVVYSDDLCDAELKPPMVRQCNGTKAKCEYNWYASQWSECSAQCGRGVQTRTLFCATIVADGTVKKVEDGKCDKSKTYETIRNCTGEVEKCPGEWFSGPWTECSKPCGGGERSKKVVCLKDLQVVDASECSPDTIIFSKEECNPQPCSEDTIIPTDITKPVDESETETTEPDTLTTVSDKEEPEKEEDYEIVETDECDDGEWVDEDALAALKEAPKPSTGEDKLGSSTESSAVSWSKETDFSMDDLMLSDAPASPDGKETEITGSGDHELTSTPSETTLEGSGDTESPWSTFETDTPIEVDSISSLGSQPTDGEMSTAAGTESTGGSEATTVASSEGTTIGGSEATTISGSEATTVGGSEATTVDSSEATTVGGSEATTVGGSEATTVGRSEATTVGGSEATTVGGSEATTLGGSEATESSAASVSSSEQSTEPPSQTSEPPEVTSTSSDLTTPEVTESASKSSDLTTETSSVSSSESSTSSDQTTESESTETTESTESTESTSSTETSESTESTESTVSSESSASTETSGSTEETETTESGPSTQSSIPSESSSSEAATESSSSTEVSQTEETTISGSSTVSEGGSTTQKEGTEATSPVSAETEEPSEAFIGESDLGSERETTKATPKESGTTLEISTSEVSVTTEVSSEVSVTTEVSSETATTTEVSSEAPVTTEKDSGTTELESTEVTTEIKASSESTTEPGGTTELPATSTEGATETTTEFTGSTEATTEFTGSTETTLVPETTTGLTGETETTEIDIWSTTESGATEGSTSVWETTPLIEIFKGKKPRMCKRKKQKTCKETQYGCCWDKITPATGPFDKGCPNPKTCNESKHGCCEDGVSPALGPNFKGCPSSHCNETLFGCCPDNKTVAEGNNNEGCPPPPPACVQSKYGCCKDNVTEAQGPDFKGCEKEEEEYTSTTEYPTSEPEDCNITTFGCCPDGVEAAEGEYYKGCNITNCNESYFRCCPDGVTPAEGPNYQGCKMPCSDNEFGCCPDGVTPAHGPSGEGCCLASAHGCCPDNILPARGPNLEGCGCQYSPYRCCPDNVTAARGHNFEGCGCQYTEHRCCPDEYTPAAGPDYQGCLCHTFQFGCCPDGVTVAKGPHQQGCGCRNTEFGCCSDDRTPAQGPNLAGCGCDSSKYGCCPDGVTESKGDNFDGCPIIPENLQEGCTQPKERGPCRNYTVKWFFDMDYGGCSRFWYGGCDGNDNRFKTKEECDGICVKPEGIDRCKLPKVPGPCEGYYPQWYYDTERKHCAQFIYGGCLGNNNRFETREECLSLCVKDESIDACEQEKEEGPCKGNYLRWYYDKESKKCQEFIYGGCKANNNNFPTEEACKQQCTQPGRKKDHCSLPRAQGNCTGREPRWYYDIPEKQCLPFYYSGCNGNNNNFNTREACETDCPKEIEKDLCHLAADIGTCGNYTTRWYFDTREKACRQFYYGGCGGNGNNFENQQQCEQRCDRRIVYPKITEAPETTEEPFSTQSCFLPSETGTCRTPELRYYYDSTDGVCKRFTYGGCGGNKNNFASVEQCLQHCGNAQDLCRLPPVVGPCNAEYEQFYYNPGNDSCVSFKYGGCDGNYNRFPDRISCEQRCKRTPPTQEAPIQTQAPPVQTVPSSVAMCYEPANSGNCNDSLSVFFYDSATGVCTPFTYTGCGGNGNRFTSEEQCERQCGKFRGQDVCNLPRDQGPCRGYFVKYYYDKGVGRCAQFAYGGCAGNGNRFSSNEECESICVTHEEKRTNVTSTAVCELPVDQGSCQDGYHKRWYFDNALGECIAFIFSGCGGNLNNFKTFQACVDFCRDYLPVTQPPATPEDHPCQAHFDECANLRCPYGIEAYVDDNQCNRCQCQNPCTKVDCPPESQCAIDINRNRTSIQDPDFIAVCREINKQGQCPTLEHRDENNCEQECRNDADCPLHLKCCTSGCGTSCVEPVTQPPAELVTQQNLAVYTEPPEQSEFYAPKVDVETYEPQVQGLIGDHVTLHCAITGNPTPRITWRKDDLLIDGTQAKYRIKLDQSLQIITLHKTDAGIYLCTADNNIGEPLTNQIKLDVVDGPPRPATVLEPETQPNIVVSLNAPTTLNCLAVGYPFPAVTWWKDDSLIPLKTSQFEVRKDYSLLIHSVKLSNLGIYTCQAYNGVGKAASWSVTVKARGPYHSTNPKDQKYLKYIVNPPELPATLATTVAPPVRPTPPPYLPPANNEINPNREPTAPPPLSVPVKTNITTGNQRYPTNSDISLPCIVEGFPTPQVSWYKDGVPIAPSEHIQISDDNILTVLRASKADSGVYQCEAANTYSKSSSSVTILVDGMFIHPNCKDNRFFANCDLIVKARFCTHKYYAKFCCRSCTEAGLLPADGSHLNAEKQTALSNNLV